MGAGDIWAAFYRPFSLGTVLAISIGHRKAWAEMGGLEAGPGWCCPMAEASYQLQPQY